MSTRSRKSSVNSRRAPASLRIPSITRRASNTQLSFVLAQGDSIKSDALSETHLSKQLDGDSGGRQMGMRSRGSSSATIRTVRTASGLKSPIESDDHSVLEEDENQGESSASTNINRNRIQDSPEPIAGPSSQPINNSSSPQRDPSPTPTINKRTLNPKQSSSWLRWNSSTPSFPKSPSVNKGKGKETEALDDADQAGEPVINPTDQLQFPSTATSSPIPMKTSPPPSTLDLQSGNGPPPIEPLSQAAPTFPTSAADKQESKTAINTATKSRGWWGRSTPKPPSVKETLSINANTTDHSAATTDIKNPSPALDSAPSKIQMSAADPAITAAQTTSSLPSQTPITVSSNSFHPPYERDTPAESVAVDSKVVPPVNVGWKGYLGWGIDRKDVMQQLAQPAHSDDPSQQILSINQSDSSSIIEAHSRETTNASMQSSHPSISTDSANNVLPAENPSTSIPPSADVEQPNVHSAAQPWSSYLYSFVVPPPRQQPPIPISNSTEYHQVEPSDPTEDQKPVHTEPPPDLSIREATSVPKPQPETLQPPSSTASTERNPDRRPSTTGWLSYLAFRVNQKNITGSSINTQGSNTKASDEEVMDFSADPDFPSSTPSQSLAPSQSAKGREVRVDEESTKTVTPKPSQNLDVRKKRLSNASLLSNGSLSPAQVSPKTRSSLDGARPSSSQQASSSLPPPPHAPAVQPNLVIPTFTDTFDRPPRSFLPPQPPEPPVEAAKGLTAATTGLAWKALGAVGNYVYGGSDLAQRITPDTLAEDEKEIRSRKEGSNVGNDLPRRIGLGSGTPDDGWRQVKRVVVVGVHGWFPAKMLNSVIGEPTGTSVKFANMMGQAVQQFFQEKGVDDIRLTLMPLEGEGTIESRVDRLYKAYLSNPAWINDLRRADAIFFAAHSQGCIVTTHLISRMIAQGHIRTPLNGEAVSRCEWAFGPIGVLPPEEPRRGRRSPAQIHGSDGGYQKVAMLAMCGVHLGPLYSISTSTVIQPYLQWFENAAARELFEFQDSTSAVSVAYQKALSMVLENEVRVVLLASLNDQVVPIYGASFSTATHPLLLRALYVDGASYTQSDFMTNLLCFAFMLRNAGIDDQRLVEHLSEATAGSLTGVGHSTPYEELSCYSIAVQYLFHAGSARQPMTPLEIEPFSARDAKNDFELPWIMRALVDSPEVKDLFPGELKDLKEGVLHWRPNTKVLKEIKKRLEPMAGRQSRLRTLHASPSTASLASNGDHGLGVSPGANKALASGKALKSRL
ncbi:uncharacterized protein L201_007553 [Kwoniella dendrophila CBS 6074]|uniref:YMC020W-like alpha/beta hydrolase domain-containing protein n=1 Tax=Kwoniella dendrophila CBS 6074 TaxID=1295534 RepID=A0AAX4K5C1_9TREE